MIKLKKIYNDAIIPKRADSGSAGYDLYAYLPKDKYIRPRETVMIGTGVAITPPPNTFGAIFARSGLATKKGLRPANCVGVADESYTGEYMVALFNDSPYLRVVKNGERIAQLVFIPYVAEDFDIVEELEETTRGSGGFGSTGQ